MEGKTRREFLKNSGIGLGAFAFSHMSGWPSLGSDRRRALPAGEAERLSLGMASYTFREFSLEETIAMTKRLGLERIALKSFHLPLESTEEEILQVAEKVRDAGLDLYGCGVVYMKSEADVRRAFDVARTAGIRIIIGAPDWHLLKMVNKMVNRYDIGLAIHNHGPQDALYPTPESAYSRIKDLDSRVGLCLDVGHTQRAGVDPSEPAERFFDRLLDVHIKDVTAATGEGRTVEIGRGVVDIPRFLKTLLDIGFQGCVSFEFEKDGSDPLPGVAESVGYVRGVLAVI